MTRIFRLLVVLAVVAGGVVWYFHWSRTRALDSGEVRVHPTPASNTATGASEPASSQSGQSQEIATNGPGTQDGDQSATQDNNVAALPASETISRNPPNGIVAVGSGRFQLYRQGDITWRLDTATGESCVLLATEAQWRKMLVYEHGCGSR